jgi:hypothetical protein
MNYKLIKIELKINYESRMNIHMNELHLSCKSDIHNIDHSKPLIKNPTNSLTQIFYKHTKPKVP